MNRSDIANFAAGGLVRCCKPLKWHPDVKPLKALNIYVP